MAAHPVIRALDCDDIPAVTDLLNTSLLYDRFPAPLVAHKVLEDPDYEEDLCRVACVGEQIVGFAQAVVRSRETACIKMVAVHPARRRMGLATQLLEQLEARLAGRAAGVSVCFARPNYFTPGLDPRYTAAAALFSRRGYERSGDGFNMSVDLSPEGPFDFRLDEWDASREAGQCTVEIWRPPLAEEICVAEWLATTGVSDAWQYQALRAFYRPRWSARPQGGLLIAQHKGEQVGFAAYDGVRPGWFGPEWVREDLRGQGVGKALLLESLRAMREDGYAEAEICLVGPLPFYAECVGATVSRIWWFFRKELAAADG